MNLDLIVLILSSVAIALVGLTVFIRNSGESSNRRFAILSLSMITWIVFNYLSDYSTTHDLLFTRLVFVGGLLTAWTLLLFMHDFPNKSALTNRKILRVHSIISACMLPLLYSPYFIQSVGMETINTGALYPLFIMYILYSLVTYGVVAYWQFHKANSSMLRRQTFVLFGSVVLYGLLTVVSNLLIPLFADDWSSSRLGPVFSLIFVSAVAYAIIRHRLFDIRPIIARAVAYALLVATLGILLFAVLFVGINNVLDEKLSAPATAVYMFSSVVLAFCLQPLKRVFDRFTNRFFYRDAYDSQELFNKFNQSLVGSVDVEELLQGSTAIVANSLKADFCVVGLEQVNSTRIRTVGTGNRQFAKEDLIHGRHLLKDVKSFPVVTDYLTPENHELKTLLEKNNIAVLAPLFEHPGQELGYLMLGAKRSGSPYTEQDIRVITTLANELSIAMQNALRFEQIEQFNATLQEKIEEATRKMRRTNDKLRKLDETKDDFISMASHQLRTPLTSVKGYVSMVLDGDAGKITDLQRKLLTQSFISSQRMVYLISDLLNVSRLRTGKFIIEPMPTNLSTMISEEIDQLQETAKGRNLTLTFNKPPAFPNLLLDETKMRQVIMNFIDNAVYYTPSGGHIEVNLMERPHAIEFTVVDDGIGVPRHEQLHLFSKFFRAHNAKRARPDGTGLGLFMAKKVIIAQGGAIVFRSQEGKGSTFGFTFAKAKLLPSDAKPASDNRPVVATAPSTSSDHRP